MSYFPPNLDVPGLDLGDRHPSLVSRGPNTDLSALLRLGLSFYLYFSVPRPSLGAAHRRRRRHRHRGTRTIDAVSYIYFGSWMPNWPLDDLQHRGPSSSDLVLRQPEKRRPVCAARRGSFLFAGAGAGAGAGLESRRRAVAINKESQAIRSPPHPGVASTPTPPIPSHHHPTPSSASPHDCPS